jgi:lipid II:glycine glycyltransferase (peptidoglycan interpeptide bridge formation enzyme)
MNLNPTQPEPDNWDAFVEARGGHLLQTSRWGRLKRLFGWQDQVVALSRRDEITAGALVLFRPLPLGLGTVAYIPRGPVVDWSDEAQVEALMQTLDEAARARRAILLKLEPDSPDSPSLRQRLLQLGFRSSPQTVQPPRTIIVDLNGTEEELLARMNQGTRRKIRLAGRKGISVRRGNASDLASFNELMRVTGQRDAFGVHSPDYYQRVFELFAPDHAALLMASYEGKDVAGLMVFAWGRTAIYLYGASSNEERERMPNHTLQWEAIRWAREQGCTTYDLWGIPDADQAELEAQFEGRHDGLWGVYGFKRGFGGRIVRAVGAWDRAYQPLGYKAYTLYTRWRGGGEG